MDIYITEKHKECPCCHKVITHCKVNTDYNQWECKTCNVQITEKIYKEPRKEPYAHRE